MPEMPQAFGRHVRTTGLQELVMWAESGLLRIIRNWSSAALKEKRPLNSDSQASILPGMSSAERQAKFGKTDMSNL